MTELRKFATAQEARLAESLLKAHKIQSSVVSGKRRNGQELHVLMVKDDQWGEALGVMTEVDGATEASRVAESASAGERGLGIEQVGASPYFRKAVMQAIGAVVIAPIVFNVMSLMNAKKDWDQSDKQSGAMLRFALIVILQIPTIFALMAMYHMTTSMSSMLQGLDGLGD